LDTFFTASRIEIKNKKEYKVASRGALS